MPVLMVIFAPPGQGQHASCRLPAQADTRGGMGGVSGRVASREGVHSLWLTSVGALCGIWRETAVDRSCSSCFSVAALLPRRVANLGWCPPLFCTSCGSSRQRRSPSRHRGACVSVSTVTICERSERLRVRLRYPYPDFAAPSQS